MKKTILAFVLGTCIAISNADAVTIWLQEVQFNVGKDMNNNAPVKVRAIVAYDPELYQKLLKMPAADYFKQEEGIKADYRGKIEIFPAEIVPGQKNDPLKVKPKDTSGAGVIIYAQYATPGAHRETLGDEGRVIQLDMQEKDFKLNIVRP